MPRSPGAADFQARAGLQPVLARKDPQAEGYILTAGERRWRAAIQIHRFIFPSDPVGLPVKTNTLTFGDIAEVIHGEGYLWVFVEVNYGPQHTYTTRVCQIFQIASNPPDLTNNLRVRDRDMINPCVPDDIVAQPNYAD